MSFRVPHGDSCFRSFSNCKGVALQDYSNGLQSNDHKCNQSGGPVQCAQLSIKYVPCLKFRGADLFVFKHTTD